jgi:SAM-dependent methyltransferase
MKYKTFHYLFFLLQPIFSHGQGEKIDSLAIERERIRWNKSLIYDTSYKFNKEPNALLIETVRALKPGKALDLGMGQGRNSIYLAMNGWDVTGVDIADEAMAFAMVQASESNVNINTHRTPMETFDFGINEWDLIIHVYEGCFDDSRISKISKALKPGGILVFEFFHREAGIEMKRQTFGCETNSIKRTIEQAGGFNILRYSEETGLADYGLRNYKLVKLVADKKL